MRNAAPKRAERARAQRNKLVYKRTEIDSQKEFDFNKIFYGLVGIFALGILYLMFFSGAFTVSEVQVNGTKEINPSSIQGMAEKNLDSEIIKKNIFLFDSDALSREIKRNYSLKSLKVKKEYPKKVIIQLKEYTSEIEWKSREKYYLIDEKGRAVAALDKKRENLVVVEDKKNLPVQIGKTLVSTDFINFVKYINQNFKAATHGNISHLEINENFNEINVYTSFGFYIIFDTTRDPSNELNNLVIALNSSDLKSTKLTYLDMRIKNKVFYK